MTLHYITLRYFTLHYTTSLPCSQGGLDSPQTVLFELLFNLSFFPNRNADLGQSFGPRVLPDPSSWNVDPGLSSVLGGSVFKSRRRNIWGKFRTSDAVLDSSKPERGPGAKFRPEGVVRPLQPERDPGPSSAWEVPSHDHLFVC